MTIGLTGHVCGMPRGIEREVTSSIGPSGQRRGGNSGRVRAFPGTSTFRGELGHQYNSARGGSGLPRGSAGCPQFPRGGSPFSQANLWCGHQTISKTLEFLRVIRMVSKIMRSLFPVAKQGSFVWVVRKYSGEARNFPTTIGQRVRVRGQGATPGREGRGRDDAIRRDGGEGAKGGEGGTWRREPALTPRAPGAVWARGAGAGTGPKVGGSACPPPTHTL